MRTGDVGAWQSRPPATDRPGPRLPRHRPAARRISPSCIENLLRASPFIAEAIVLGHGRKYLTALIEIDFEMVADWARSNDVAYRGFTSLAQAPRITALIAGAIERPTPSWRASSRSRRSGSCPRCSIPRRKASR